MGCKYVMGRVLNFFSGFYAPELFFLHPMLEMISYVYPVIAVIHLIYKVTKSVVRSSPLLSHSASSGKSVIHWSASVRPCEAMSFHTFSYAYEKRCYMSYRLASWCGPMTVTCCAVGPLGQLLVSVWSFSYAVRSSSSRFTIERPSSQVLACPL